MKGDVPASEARPRDLHACIFVPLPSIKPGLPATEDQLKPHCHWSDLYGLL